MTCFPEKGLESLPQGRPLRIKFGIDPTRDRLHLGHFVPIRVVRSLQEQGHEVHLVLGTFTACMGDPSGQDKTRPFLSPEVVRANGERILERVQPLLLPGIHVHRNHEWFDAMSVPFLLMRLAGRFTVANLLSRDGFRQRVEEHKPIGLHELVVPLLQGWDSVELRADIEIGGTDQLFNFATTRELQVAEGQKPEVCLMTPVIAGTDGRKMSKSFDNCIFLDEVPEEIFGKVLSISDTVMEEWIPLLTDGISVTHPMERKKALAFDIIRQVHGVKAAQSAQAHFEATVQRKEIGKVLFHTRGTLLDIVSSVQAVSRTEARRLIQNGAVTMEGATFWNPHEFLSEGLFRIGKRTVVRIE